MPQLLGEINGSSDAEVLWESIEDNVIININKMRIWHLFIMVWFIYLRKYCFKTF